MPAVRAGLLPEQFGRQILARAAARAGKADFAWLFLAQRNHFLDAVSLLVWWREQYVLGLDWNADEVEIGQRVVGCIGQQMRRDDLGVEGRDHGGGGTCDLVGTDRGGRSRLVVDEKRLAKAVAHFLRHCTRYGATLATCREGHDAGDGLGWPCLGDGGLAEHGHAGHSGHGGEEFFHCLCWWLVKAVSWELRMDCACSWFGSLWSDWAFLCR